MRPAPGGIIPLALVQSGAIRDLSATALRVLVVLMGHANVFSGATTVTPPTIGREAGLGPRNVRRAVSELVKRGLVKATSRLASGYTLTVVQTFSKADRMRPPTDNAADAARPPRCPQGDFSEPAGGRGRSAASKVEHLNTHSPPSLGGVQRDTTGGRADRDAVFARLRREGVAIAAELAARPDLTLGLIERVILHRPPRDNGGWLAQELRRPGVELEHDYPGRVPRSNPGEQAAARRATDLLDAAAQRAADEWVQARAAQPAGAA